MMSKYCEQCGTELEDNAMFCPECGTRLTFNEDATDNSSEKKGLFDSIFRRKGD